MELSYKELLEFNPPKHDLLKVTDILGTEWNMNARQAFDKGVKIPHILWVMGRMGMRDELVAFTWHCIEHASHLINGHTVTTVVFDCAVNARCVARTAEYAISAVRNAGYAASSTEYGAEIEWQKDKLIEILEKGIG